MAAFWEAVNAPSLPAYSSQLRCFAEWKAYTNPDTGKAGWISDGGQVRYDNPHREEAHGQGAEAIAQHVQESIPELKDNPTLWERVKNSVVQAGASVYLFALKADPVVQKVLTVAGLILDTPQDMAKVGYNPNTSSGTANVQMPDPIKGNIGISGHLALHIASTIIAKGLSWLRSRRQSQQNADTTDPIAQAAAQLAALYNQVNQQLGLPATYTAADVEAALRDNMPGDARANADPASGEVALAGKDGRLLNDVVRASKTDCIRVFAEVTRAALESYSGKGPLFTPEQEGQLAEALASVNSVADLLARSRIRQAAERLSDDDSARKFADTPAGIITSPEAAVSYFQSLTPKLGIDPERFPEAQRRKAFTLAASTNEILTRKVQAALAQSLQTNEPISEAKSRVDDLLTAAGVNPKNPQYTEMVARTNAMDSFTTAQWEEMTHPDVAELFPVWQYVGIDDERAGEDHRPKFGRYFSASEPFAKVRGNRPFNCRCCPQAIYVDDWKAAQARGIAVSDGMKYN